LTYPQEEGLDLDLNEEQKILKKEARDFLADKFPMEYIEELEASEEGYSREIWEEMAELGWMALPFPEEYGGIGMSFLELAILLEEMGRACLPGPYFSTVILGGLPICDVGSDKQKQEYLPKIVRGKTLFTLALTEPSATYDAAGIEAKATANEDGYVLNGTKLFVPDPHIADHMLAVAKTNDGKEPEAGMTIFIVDAKSPGLSSTLLKTIAGDKVCEVAFDEVRVAGDSILGRLDYGWSEVQKVVLRAAAARCCEMVGAMGRVLEMTVDYAKNRVQYGRPIGNFQVIQHYCANMMTDLDISRLTTYHAAWMLSEGLSCTKEVAVAKALTNEACRRVASWAHQIHGAIGFTMEHDLQLYSRRTKASEVTFGDADFHYQIIAGEIGL
jgi:alkylation response protein AidB-like acyl-CoA dehydrogenase